MKKVGAPLFRDWIGQAPTGSLPLLPFLHTTEAVNLNELLSECRLTPSWCGVFSEDLLYFFYGRASYRPMNSGTSRTDWAYFPITFILDYSGLPEAKRAYPFDTGAYASGIFEKFFHKKFAMEDFEFSEVDDFARRFVGAVFGSNSGYVFGEHRIKSPPEFSFQSAKSYLDLVASTGETIFDDRRSALEVQIDKSVSLTSGNLLAVILPKKALDDNRIRDTILGEWRATPITYNTYAGSSSADYYGVIREKLTDFLIRRGSI
jgi:hypothetical protein